MKLSSILGMKSYRSLIRLLTPIILISLVVTGFQDPVFAAGKACHPSSPSSAAYSVTVCVTAPAEGATISGTKNVTATVNTTGTNPIGGEHSRLTCDIAFDDCVGILRWRNAGIS
jgi:hypothetical protein